MREFRERVQAHALDALAELVAQLKANGPLALTQRFKAATKLIELAYGTPTPWQDEDGVPVDIKAKPPGERERLLRERGEMLIAAADRERRLVESQPGEKTEH